MRLLKVAKYLTDGDEIRLSFWPKGMHFKIGRENEKASLLYRYYNGSDKGSLKMAFKSIVNIFSDKWEVKPPEFDKDGNKIKYYKYNEKVEDKDTRNKLEPSFFGNCKCDNHIEVMYNTNIKKSKSAKKVK